MGIFVKKSSRKGRWLSFLPWALTFLWMGMIFLFSAQDAAGSSQLSGQTAFHSAFWFWPGFSALSPEEQLAWVESVQFWVRKSAHFLVYAGLGFLLCWSFSSLSWGSRKKIVLAWLTGTFYAATDEFHQLFVPGRSGQLRDVLLDSAGVLTGIFLFFAAEILCKKIKAAANAVAKRIGKN